MATSDQQILDATRAKILEIVTSGQSVSSDGRTLSEADLGQLRDLEREYAARVARASRRHSVVRMVVE